MPATPQASTKKKARQLLAEPGGILAVLVNGKIDGSGLAGFARWGEGSPGLPYPETLPLSSGDGMGTSGDVFVTAGSV